MDKKREDDLKTLSKLLRCSFKNLAYLDAALVHRSFLHENPDYPHGDNERLEFLGDAVLSLVISDFLYQTHPFLSEGNLTKMRSALINIRTLAQLARNLGLGNYLLLGRGEEKSGGRQKDSLLANALEAVWAAIYLDSGMEKASRTIKRLFEPLLRDRHAIEKCSDPKSELQEFCRRFYRVDPIYQIKRKYGPEHDLTFQVNVIIPRIPTQCGEGKSKKEAEKNAAQKAWQFIQKIKK